MFMRIPQGLVIVPLMLLLVSACISDDSPLAEKKPDTSETSADAGEAFPYTIQTVAEDLNVPWELEVASDGRIFFTERSGAVRVIDKGKLLPDPVIRLEPPFLSVGEGGLLGLALDPQFERTHYMYIYHTYEADGEIRNRVLRLKEKDNTAAIDRVLIDGLPGSQNHNGGRIRFGPDRMLYITSGDRYEPELAQNVKSLGGKILRIGADGSIPGDNPFPDSPVYSYGHRNPQGLAWHPDTKQLYASEHGQSAHDEINRIEKGANYGWPLIEGDETLQDPSEMKTPLLHSGTETWAPSGMTFVTKGPWKGSLLVANLRGEQVLKVTLKPPDYREAVSQEPVFREWGRIRNIREAADGSLYVLTNNRDGRGFPREGDDKIIRLIPKS